ncbi:MAG: hypothetical protein ACRDTA_02705 [Pseudonocardiaceae bacterium]
MLIPQQAYIFAGTLRDNVRYLLATPLACRLSRPAPTGVCGSCMGNRGDLAARSPATARRDRRAVSRRRCALRGAGTAAAPGDDPGSERSFLEELLGGHHYLAARADGQLVGYAGIVFVTGPAG